MKRLTHQVRGLVASFLFTLAPLAFGGHLHMHKQASTIATIIATPQGIPSVLDPYIQFNVAAKDAKGKPVAFNAGSIVSTVSDPSASNLLVDTGPLVRFSAMKAVTVRYTFTSKANPAVLTYVDVHIAGEKQGHYVFKYQRGGLSYESLLNIVDCDGRLTGDLYLKGPDTHYYEAALITFAGSTAHIQGTYFTKSPIPSAKTGNPIYNNEKGPWFNTSMYGTYVPGTRPYFFGPLQLPDYFLPSAAYVFEKRAF